MLQIKFLDVYDDYADENGALLAQLSDGNVHINHESNEHIQRKLYQILYEIPPYSVTL